MFVSPAIPTVPMSCSDQGEPPPPLPFTLMLSNVAVDSTPSLWLVTARPTRTGAPIEITTGDPTCVQDVPFTEVCAVNVSPVRTSFSQAGLAIAGPQYCAQLPP